MRAGVGRRCVVVEEPEAATPAECLATHVARRVQQLRPQRQPRRTGHRARHGATLAFPRDSCNDLGTVILARVVAIVSRPLTRLVFRPVVSGVHNLPRGGFVLSANHLSGYDGFALAYAVAGRRLRSMAKNELFARRFLGPIVRGLGGFPAQEIDGVGGLATATSLARRGEVVVIFPTGARLRLDKEHRPHTGAARAALSAGVPLVPCALRGTDGWRERTQWHIAVGPAVDVTDLAAGDPGNAREATSRLWSAVGALQAELDAKL